MSRDPSPSAPIDLVLVLGAGLICVVVAAVGAPVAARIWGAGAGTALVGGCVVGWVSAVVGSIPLARSRNRGEAERAMAFLASTGLRLGVALILGGAVAWVSGLARVPLLIGLTVSYLALLGAETWYALGVAKKAAAAEKRETS